MGSVGPTATAADVAASVGTVRTSRFMQQVRALRSGVFSSFQIMKRKEETPMWRTGLDKVLEALQIISFAVASDAGFKWNSRVIQSISILTNITIVPPSITGPMLYLALFFLAMSWCLLVLGLFMWSSISFMKGGVQRIWPLRLLAVLGSLSSGFLFIPVTSGMLSVYTCGPYEKHPMWRQSGFDCYAGGHLVLVIISSIVTALFIGVVACFTLLFFESNLLDDDLNAKSHGRADTLQLMVKLLLVVCVTHFSTLIGVGPLVVILIVCGLVCLFNYAYFMPYLRHGVNQFMVAAAALQAWFAICLLLTVLYSDYDAATTLYLGIPPVILFGLWLANYRTAHVLHTSASQLSNAYEVDFKVRLLLHAAVYGHPTKRLTPRQLERRVTLLERLAARRSAGATATAADEGDASEDEGLNIPEEQVNLLRRDKGASGASTALSDEDSTRELFKRLLEVIPSRVLDGVEDVYRDAIERFRSSSMALVFAARYYSKWRANRHLEMMYLAHAEKRSPFLDARYLIHSARGNASATGSAGTDVSALSRVTFETYLRAARKHMLGCLSAQAAFWAELREPVPDISTLQRHTRTMLVQSQAAEKAFSELMTLNSSSLVVLRLYAQFNLHVANNPDKAQVILAEAERMDEQQAKDQAGESSVIRIMEIAKVDVMADNTAVVTLGATSGNLGIILSCNAMTCRMFGYSRWQLERRNVKMLVPDPIAPMHDSFLRSFMETGVGNVVDYTRVVFGLHKSGLIFPMVLAVREQPSVDGPATFVGIMRPLNTQEHHMLLDSEFRVYCVSAASASLLDVEPQMLMDTPRYLGDWVPNLEMYMGRLKMEKGCVVPVSTARASKLVAMRRDASQGIVGVDGRITTMPGAMMGTGAGTGMQGGMPGTMGKLGPGMGGGPGMGMYTQNGMGGYPGGPMGGMGGPVATVGIESEDELSFVHAHVQTVTIRNGTVLHVVHWTHARKAGAAAASRRNAGSAEDDDDEEDDDEGHASSGGGSAFSNRAEADVEDTAGDSSLSSRAPPPGHPPIDGRTDSRGCPFMINVGVLDRANRRASGGSKPGTAPAPAASPDTDDDGRDALADVLMDLVNGEETRAAAAADGIVIKGLAPPSQAAASTDRTVDGPVASIETGASGSDGVHTPPADGTAASSETAGSPLPTFRAPGMTRGRSTVKLQNMLPNILALREGEGGATPSVGATGRTAGSPPAGARFAEVVSQAMASPQAVQEKTGRGFGDDGVGRTGRTYGEGGKGEQDKDVGGRGSAFEKGTRISGPGGQSSLSSRRNMARRIQDRLRRILSENMATLLPSLRLLKLMSLAVTLGTIALGISLSVLLVTSIRSDLLTVSEVDRAASNFMAAASINSDTLSLRVASRVLPSMIKPLLQEITTLSTIMQVNTRQLFEIADDYGVSFLYTRPTVSITGSPGTDEGSPPTAGGTGPPATVYRRALQPSGPPPAGGVPPASLDVKSADLLTAGLVFSTASAAYAATAHDHVSSGAAAAVGCTRFGAALNASIGQEFSPAFLLGPGEGLKLKDMLGKRLYGQANFLVMNGGPGASLQQNINATMLQWHSRATTTLDEVRSESRALYAGFTASIAVITLVLYVPLLVHIDRIKVEYVLPLLSLPAKVANHLRRIADRDLKRLDVTEDAEDGNESDSDPEKRVKDLEDDEVEADTDAFGGGGSASDASALTSGVSQRGGFGGSVAAGAPSGRYNSTGGVPVPPSGRKSSLQSGSGAPAAGGWEQHAHLAAPLTTIAPEPHALGEVTLAAAAEALAGSHDAAVVGGSYHDISSLSPSRAGSVQDYAGVDSASHTGVGAAGGAEEGSGQAVAGPQTFTGAPAGVPGGGQVSLPVPRRHPSAAAVHPWPPAGTAAPVATAMLRTGGAAPEHTAATLTTATAGPGRSGVYGAAVTKKRKGDTSATSTLSDTIPSAFWLSRFVSSRSGTSTSSRLSGTSRTAAQLAARRFKRSMRNLGVLLGKFLIGPLGAVIFLTVLYLVYAVVSSRATSIITLATASHLRTADILAYQAAIGYVFGLPITGSPDYVFLGNETSRYLRANAIQTLNDVSASLWYHNQLLTYGTSAPPGFEVAVRGAMGASEHISATENARIQATVFGDACTNMFATHNLVGSLTAASLLGYEPAPADFAAAVQGLTTASLLTTATTPTILGASAITANQPPAVTVATGAACRTIADSVLTRGLSAGIASLLVQGNKLAKLAQSYLDGTSNKPGLGPLGFTANVSSVLEACVAPDVVPDGWSQPTPSKCATDLLNFMILAQRFAAPISDGITRVFFAEQFTSMAQVSAFSIAFTSVALIVFLAYHFVVFTPLVVQANRDIKEQRAMFLVLPASTIERLPKLRALLLNIVEGEESNGRTAPAADSEGSDGSSGVGRDGYGGAVSS